MVEALYSLLTEDKGLAEVLASYRRRPAVFNQFAPADTDEGWAGSPQFPRVIFTIEMRDDPERHSSGQLVVDIVCTHETVEPERIEVRIRSLLDGVFFTRANKETHAVMWDQSELFDEREPGKSESAKALLGIVATYDVVEFPVQLTTNPDPVQGMNLWSHETLNGVLAVGHDTLPQVWRPRGEQAAVYWRLSSLRPANRPDSWSVSWHHAELVGHIVAERHSLMQANCKILIERMQQQGEIILADGSPMFINRLTYTARANPVKEGQITVSGMYGVLRQPEYAPWLHPNTRYQNKGGST